MNTDFIQIGNGEAVARDRIPLLAFDNFRSQALQIVANGGKVVHFFAYPDGDGVNLLAVLRSDHLLLAGCRAPEVYPSLTSECAPFHMFEREIAEQFGIRPEGHPWLKLVRYHANERGLPDVFGNDYDEDIPGNYEYYAVEGEEIHEVVVGPVHAGVIEPGHFRFNCIGERVLHLEIQLGHQHRGVEKLLLNADVKRLPILAEGIAGDTAVGHSLCMAQAVESLAAINADTGARIIRTIGLELERIANHVGDLGALSGDVAFLPPANYFGRMRGDFLNMSLWMCGNRFGKGLVRPGGVRFPLTDEDRRVLAERIAELNPQVKHVINLLFATSSVRSRFEGCGVVSTSDAEKLGLVGPAGRASGIPYDVRRNFPMEHYHRLDIPRNAEPTGDVYARAKVRADEVLQPIAIIESLLSNPIETSCVEGTDFQLVPSSLAVTVNEGCNACEADLNVLATPFFDLARFGINFVASPRHADGIVVTGPVSRNMKTALLQTYEATPAPKVVIAVGSCALSGGPFRGSSEITEGLDQLLPVDLYIPGCPPHPLTNLHALLTYFK